MYNRLRDDLVVYISLDNGHNAEIKRHPPDEDGDDYGWDIFIDGEWVHNEYFFRDAVSEAQDSLEQWFFEEVK